MIITTAQLDCTGDVYGKEKAPICVGVFVVPTFVGLLQNQSSKHICVIGSSPRLWGNGSALWVYYIMFFIICQVFF